MLICARDEIKLLQFYHSVVDSYFQKGHSGLWDTWFWIFKRVENLSSCSERGEKVFSAQVQIPIIWKLFTVFFTFSQSKPLSQQESTNNSQQQIVGCYYIVANVRYFKLWEHFLITQVLGVFCLCFVGFFCFFFFLVEKLLGLWGNIILSLVTNWKPKLLELFTTWKMSAFSKKP